LRWIFERCEGQAATEETPIGLVPRSLGTDGLDVDLAELLKVDREEWRAEVESIEEHYAVFGDHLPKALIAELGDLRSRLR
jgi:phosphoenolpyruvate carboxykinase (GTP)